MKRIFRKILASVLPLSFLVTSFGCQDKGSNNAVENLEWFSVHAHEKVLRNKDYADKSDKTLDITLCKNEYEGTQLILAAKSDIESYDIEISPLVSGKAIFNGGVKVYNEKYMTLLHKKGANPVAENGDEIADAILPFDTAKEYKENYVDKGNNQGVYIEVNTDESTLPGTYTATVTITADGQKYYAPLIVTVYDIVLPLQSEAQNFWNNVFYTQYGTSEMDTTDTMTELYLDKMLEYKLNGTLPFSGNGGAEAYVELVKEYYNKPGFSCYQFYYQGGRVGYTHKDRETGEYVTEYANYNSPLMKDYIKAVARASVEDRVNYLDKAMFYFLTIDGADEPIDEYDFARSTEVARVFRMVIEDVAYELKDEYAGTTAYTYYTETVFDTILGLDILLTVTGNTIRGEMESRGAEYTYCPNIGCIGTQDMRDYYAGMGDWWYYTSNSPYYPTATHHLDDMYTSLVSLGWIQKVYGIKGYLNWNVADYLERGYNAYTVDRVSYFSPGDGWVLYPGYEYGITGPVGSLRAVALRDGIDDYDLFSVMQQKYQERGFSEQETLEMVELIFERFVSDTVPAQSCEVYQAAKSEIYDNIFSVNDELGLLICGKSYLGGKTTLAFDTVNPDATVEYKGQVLSRGENGRYQVTVDLKETQALEVVVKYNGEQKTVTKTVGGTYEVTEGFESGKTGSLFVNASSKMSVQSDSNFIYGGGKSTKITLKSKFVKNDAKGNPVYEQVYFALDESLVNKAITQKVDEIEVLVYSAYADEIKITLKGFTGVAYKRLADYTIKPGWNSIVLKNAAQMLSTYSYKELCFIADSFVGDMQADIYVDEIAFIKKGE